MKTVAPFPSNPAATEWDAVRTAFAASIMVDVPLTSLAQNLDGPAWPFSGENETPAAYVDYSYEELAGALRARGQPDGAAELLRILRETLAFDQPFGEMVEQTRIAADRDNPLLRTLARLGIAESFPMELAQLDETARDLCRLEGIRTLGEFAVFAQKLAQGVIVGGELRRLLNAVVHEDPATLAELLPFRPGTTGLHLAEALAQAQRHADAVRHARLALLWFGEEAQSWRNGIAQDKRHLRRQLAPLQDEAVIAQVTTLYHSALSAESSTTNRPRRSLWSCLTRPLFG